MDAIRLISRRLRDLSEPIAGAVYFLPEVQEEYGALGFENFWQSYFTSRGACLGKPSWQLVCAAFGVFNPDVVEKSVVWKAEPQKVLDARADGTTRGLKRVLGEADVTRAVAILRPVMESVDWAGRALFSGLRSLPFPDDPATQLWRVCDYVRERRGDGHIAAWVSHGCDPTEISLLTELSWGLALGTYSPTRGWSKEEIAAGITRLEEKNYVRDGAMTDEGRAYRRSIEAATDAGEKVVVDALGDSAEELFSLLVPLQEAVLEAKAYPVDPASTMNRDDPDAT
jgi:hypothetical protein